MLFPKRTACVALYTWFLRSDKAHGCLQRRKGILLRTSLLLCLCLHQVVEWVPLDLSYVCTHNSMY